MFHYTCDNNADYAVSAPAHAYRTYRVDLSFIWNPNLGLSLEQTCRKCRPTLLIETNFFMSIFHIHSTTLCLPGMSHFCRPKWHNHLIALAAAQLIKSLHNSSTTRLDATAYYGLAFSSLISWPVIFTCPLSRGPAKNKSIILFLSVLNAYPWSWSRGKRLTCHLTNQTTQLLGASVGSDLGLARTAWNQAVNLFVTLFTLILA